MISKANRNIKGESCFIQMDYAAPSLYMIPVIGFMHRCQPARLPVFTYTAWFAVICSTGFHFIVNVAIDTIQRRHFSRTGKNKVTSCGKEKKMFTPEKIKNKVVSCNWCCCRLVCDYCVYRSRIYTPANRKSRYSCAEIYDNQLTNTSPLIDDVIPELCGVVFLSNKLVNVKKNTKFFLCNIPTAVPK